MFRRLTDRIRAIIELWLLAVLTLACSPGPEPLDGPPGDEQALAWEPTCECTDRRHVACPEPGKDLIIKDSCTHVQGCTVPRLVVVGRKYASWRDIPADWSREPGYVDAIRAAAPCDVLVEDVTVEGDGRLPVVLGVGVTQVTLRRLRVSGLSESSLVYLRAESSRVTIEDSLLDGSYSARTEVVSVDASDYLTVTGTHVVGHGKTLGAVGFTAYRNCGEGGRTRVTTSSFGYAAGNSFDHVQDGFWLSSRDGDEDYCDEDNGWPVGSSGSDLDHAREWVIEGEHAGVRFGKSSTGNLVHGRVRP